MVTRGYIFPNIGVWLAIFLVEYTLISNFSLSVPFLENTLGIIFYWGWLITLGINAMSSIVRQRDAWLED